MKGGDPVMKVGWVGLGKLGLPCAAVLAQHHAVHGYDVSDRPWRVASGKELPNREEGLQELLAKLEAEGREIRRCGSIADVVARSGIIFVAVQTPHSAEYGGERPMPEEQRDFEYAYLIQACRGIAAAALAQRKKVTIAVVSTVLPGTTDRFIRPLLNPYTRLLYTPQFIAMGTTVADFSDPEFVICGGEDPVAQEELAAVFFPVHEGNRLHYCDISTAESIKVLYNTFISMKIVWANHVMEMCHATGADCDSVVSALSKATSRVVSSKYMRGGMGDGGACHPRDLIAMSWLESRLGMSFPLFGELARAREVQAEWLADLIGSYADQSGLPIYLMGESYKPESDLTDGSPALLVRHYLEKLGKTPVISDPYSGSGLPEGAPLRPALYAITTKHEEWREQFFPSGSVVVDPFGYIPDRPGVTVIRVGRR